MMKKNRKQATVELPYNSINPSKIMLSERGHSQKGYMLHDSMYTIFQKRKNYRNGNQLSTCQELGWRAESFLQRAIREIFCYATILCCDWREKYRKINL